MEDVRRGAFTGFAAWGAYGIGEAFFVWLLPALGGGEFRFDGWHWRFGVALLLLYPAAGAAIGAAGAMLSGKNERLSGVFPVAVLGLLLAANLARAPSGDPLHTAIAVLAFCGAAVSAAAPFVSALDARTRAVQHPWTLPIAFTAASWLVLRVLDSASTPARIVALLVVVGVALVVPSLFSRLSAASLAAATAAGMVLVAALGLPLVQSEPEISSIARSAEPDGEPPPVVLIVLDNVSARRLSHHGHSRETSPNLERFAERATTYTRAIAPSDFALSSYASLWTGMYARRHGAHLDERGLGRPLGGDFRTIAEILAEAGYLTLGVAANHVFFGAGYGLEQGFDRLELAEPDDYVLYHRLGIAGRLYLWSAVHALLQGTAAREQLDNHFMRAEDVNALVFRTLDEASKQPRPFFLFADYLDAHPPHLPPPPFDTFAPGKSAAMDRERLAAMVSEVVRQRSRKIAPEERAHLESQYDGSIAYLDASLGKLFDRLAAAGVYERALVIVTSSHGESFGDRDLVGHGVSVYEDQVHVPLLVKLPGQTEARRSDETVSLVDVLPTICQLAGAELPDDLDGVSLAAPDADRAGRVIVSESYPNVALLGPSFQRVETALYSGAQKLITSTAGKKELYDLSADPGETRDTYSLEGGAASLETKLQEWFNAVQPAAVDTGDLDAEAVERLKALGYM